MSALTKRTIIVSGVLLCIIFLGTFAHLFTDTTTRITAMFEQDPRSGFNSTLFDLAEFDHPLLAPNLKIMQKTGLNISKVATLVETRPAPMLLPILLHFIASLPADWPFRVYYGPDNFEMLTSSGALKQHIQSKKVTLVPMKTDFKGIWGWSLVSDFLTTREFWENQAPAKYVLMFQLDSILCSRSRASIEDFMGYDFVGAPINPFFREEKYKQPGQVWMNGGLSLRDREAMLRVIDEAVARDEPYGKNPLPAEDLWFSEMLYQHGGNLPTEEFAKSFSVETLYYETPFAVHNYEGWLFEDDKLAMDKYCPEYMLASKKSKEPEKSKEEDAKAEESADEVNTQEKTEEKQSKDEKAEEKKPDEVPSFGSDITGRMVDVPCREDESPAKCYNRALGKYSHGHLL